MKRNVLKTQKAPLDFTLKYPDLNLLITDPPMWLAIRDDYLIYDATKRRLGCNLSKSLGVVCSVAALATINVNPLSPLALIFGGLGYAWTVGKDFSITDNLRPLPFVPDARKLWDDFTKHEDDKTEDNQNDLFQGKQLKCIDWLSERERHEAAFLAEYRGVLGHVLTGVGTKRRFVTYLTILNDSFTNRDNSRYCRHLKELKDGHELIEMISIQDLDALGRQLYPSKSMRVIEAVQTPELEPAVDRDVAAGTYGYEFQGSLGETIDVPSSYKGLVEGIEIENEPQNPKPSNPVTSIFSGFSKGRKKQKPIGYQVFSNTIYDPSCVLGWQRGGKTLMLAETSKLEAQKGAKIFYTSMAAKTPDMDGRWNHAYRKIEVNLSRLSRTEAAKVISEANEMLEEFLLLEGEDRLYILDEWMITAGQVHKYADLLLPFLKSVSSAISEMASSGIKDNAAIHVLAPNFRASSLVKTYGVCPKDLRLVLVSVNDGHFIECNGKKIGCNKAVLKTAKNNFDTQFVEMPPGLEGDRVVLINGDWMTLGDASNLPKIESKTTSAPKTKENSTPKGGKTAKNLGKKVRSLDPLELHKLLEKTSQRWLWEFVVNDLGYENHDQILEMVNLIAHYLGQTDPKLGKKFVVGDVYRPELARLSYKGRKKVRSETIALTDGTCCLCQESEATKVYQTNYDGPRDRAGHNSFPVCYDCQEDICYSKQNWEPGGKNIWDAHATEAFSQYITRAALEMV
ncbi:hypothetical protein [Moorena sp. SIO3I8]|uniref:hypothetical protein n=1 Tax=Moorena sp. SIO3I8 TaxID=2607833 RepID=UPI0013C1578C|nr:hypothetical protein [Moorena sp. SIO3I8]NEO08750.1 hypothetical protein [Moorena sp. SIO3I8]